MLSRNIQLAGAEDWEHLVTELNRPKVRVGGDVAAQIEGCDFSVTDDERFRSGPAVIPSGALQMPAMMFNHGRHGP